MHKICFVEKRGSIPAATMPGHMHQTAPVVDPSLKELITSLSVTDRPDLMIYRKFSEAGRKGHVHKSRKKRRESTKAGGEEGMGSIGVNKNIANIKTTFKTIEELYIYISS